MRQDLSDGPRPGSLRLGVILAGGQSRRFGSPKALAMIGGVTLVERVARPLMQAGARPVLITGPHLPDLSHLLPCRSDLRPGLGPLSGLHTALVWARELGLSGTLCVACDMPFLSAGLLRRIAELGEASHDTVIVPESGGPRGIEPLCAWYPASAARVVLRQLESEVRTMAALLAQIRFQVLPLAEVAAFGDPARLFYNVNTVEDRDRFGPAMLDAEEGNGRG